MGLQELSNEELLELYKKLEEFLEYLEKEEKTLAEEEGQK